MYIEDYERTFNPGSKVIDSEGGIWLRLADSDVNHIVGCVASEKSGIITHISRLPPPLHLYTDKRRKE